MDDGGLVNCYFTAEKPDRCKIGGMSQPWNLVFDGVYDGENEGVVEDTELKVRDRLKEELDVIGDQVAEVLDHAS